MKVIISFLTLGGGETGWGCGGLLAFGAESRFISMGCSYNCSLSKNGLSTLILSIFLEGCRSIEGISLSISPFWIGLEYAVAFPGLNVSILLISCERGLRSILMLFFKISVLNKL